MFIHSWAYITAKSDTPDFFNKPTLRTAHEKSITAKFFRFQFKKKRSVLDSLCFKTLKKYNHISSTFD